MNRNRSIGILAVAMGALALVGDLAAQASPGVGAKDLFYRQLRSVVNATPEAPAQPANVGMTYSIELLRDGKAYKVDSRFPFQSGDQIRFHVQSNVDGYMYVFLENGSSGNRARLYPPEAIASEDNKVTRGTDYLIPRDGVLVFDETPGVETLQLALSSSPLSEKAISAHERGVVVRPKAPATVGKNYVVAFDNKHETKLASFNSEPAMTLVSTDITKPLTVDLVLKHERAGTGANKKVPEVATAPANKNGAAISSKPPRNKTAIASKPPATATRMTPPSAVPTNIDRTVKDVKNAVAPSLVQDKWALIVGVAKHKDSRLNLRYPAKDAKDFAQYLVQEGRFAADHVHVLTDEQATRENILTELGSKWLPQNVKPGDLVVLYIAGHGTSSAQDVAHKNFLVAYDTDTENLFATGIEMNDLARTLKRRLDSDRILIVLDTCHAGAAETGSKALEPTIPAFKIEQVLQGSGQMVIASSSSNQTSHDSLRYSNGIFTKHLIDGLRQFTDLKTVFSYTRGAVQSEALKDFGRHQTPVLKDGAWQGGKLVLSAPPANPRQSAEDK